MKMAIEVTQFDKFGKVVVHRRKHIVDKENIAPNKGVESIEDRKDFYLMFIPIFLCNKSPIIFCRNSRNGLRKSQCKISEIFSLVFEARFEGCGQG